MPRNPGHVFVSHARQDEADARRVVDALKSAGLNVWWDEQLPTHRMFSQVLEERIRSADAVVVLWSKHAAASEWVRAEADLARTLGTLVQATVNGDLPPLPFNQIHCAQLAGWNGRDEHREWRKVLDGVYAVANLTSTEHMDATTQVQKPRKKLLVLGALLAVALVTIGTAFYVWNPAAQPTPAAAARFAVLPFQTIGEDAAAIRFASELTDIVTGSLSEHQIQTFAPAQASILAGEGHRTALQALGADLALTGTVTATDGRLRVRAYLEDVPTGATVWSATFEQPLDKTSPLMIQVSTAVTETAFAVAEMLQQPGVRPDARILGLYLKTTEFMKGAKSHREALNLAEQIITLEPQLAAGHATLSALLSLDPAMAARARVEANIAIALHPASAGSAYDGLHFLTRLETPLDLRLAEAQLIQGLRDAPAFPYLHMRHCIFLVDVGRTGEGLSACEQAVALRPLSPPPTHHLARAWFAAGEIERAIQLVDRNVERYPAQPTARLIQLETRLYSDRWREADRLLSDDPIIALLGPVAVAVLKTTLHALNSGTGADADHAIAQATAAVQAGLLDPRERVLIAARLGRTEQALSWLTQMPAGSLVGKFILFHPGISALRRDPRFMQIAAREGLITYWRETNKWPDFCSDPTLPYDCRSTANALVPGVDAPNEESGSGSNKAT